MAESQLAFCLLGLVAPLRLSCDLGATPGITLEGPREDCARIGRRLRAAPYSHESCGCRAAGSPGSWGSGGCNQH